MKATRANVEEYAKQKGYLPTQIDGIPEGFSYIESDLVIGGKTHKGRIVKIKPLVELNDAISYE